MADLLTHVLVAYALAGTLSLRDDRVTPAAVTMAMIGATVPDLNRIGLVVPEAAIAAALGVPFSWEALLTVGGIGVVVAAGLLLMPPEHRRLMAAMCCLGVVSHLALDYLLLFPSGYAHPYLWPVTAHALPGPDLYVSSDRWPAAVAVAVAAVVAGVRRS